jgi:hypothetical protein
VSNSLKIESVDLIDNGFLQDIEDLEALGELGVVEALDCVHKVALSKCLKLVDYVGLNELVNTLISVFKCPQDNREPCQLA